MIYARQRKDLREQGLRIPLKTGGYIDLDDWVLASQPDYLDNEEFNTILFLPTGAMRVASVDLEFKPVHEAVATLPNGEVAVLGNFGTHKEALEFVNNVTLGAN